MPSFSYTRWTAAAVLLATSSVAHADFSSTITATSDYDFRGISQSAKDPALSASLDYAFDNGFAIGAWASNIDFGDCCDEDIEVDLYAGYSQSFESGFNWNAGAVYYLYPGAKYLPGDEKLDYWEIYVGAGYGNFSTKFWYSDDFANFESVTGESASAWYLEANYTVPLPKDFSLGLHAGMSRGDYWEGLEYEDLSVSLSKPLGNFNVSLKYIYPLVDDELEVTSDVFNNEDRLQLNISTTLPWGD